MKNRKQKIIELVAINILWNIIVFGSAFFIHWTTDLSTLKLEERGIIVTLIAIVLVLTFSIFFDDRKKRREHPIWFVTEEQAKKLRELNFEYFEVVTNPQAEDLYKDYIGIVEDRKNKGFSYEILGLRKTISYFYNTYEEAREALIREMINIYEIKNPKK